MFQHMFSEIIFWKQIIKNFNQDNSISTDHIYNILKEKKSSYLLSVLLIRDIHISQYAYEFY